MLHTTLRQLQIFSTVASHLSFARAAEELHLTPPAVTMQVRQLEQSLGLPLFNRGGQRISLTVTGEYFLVYARRALASLKEGEDLIARLRRVETGRLTIGMVGTAKYFLPRLMTEFLQAHPGIEIRLLERNREKLVESLQSNEVDLAIMGRPPRELDTRSEAFASHPLGFIAAAHHPLADLDSVRPEQLANEAFIIRERGSGTRMAMEACFADWQITPPVIMQMTSNETIKQAVMANMGLSFLSLQATEHELRSRRLNWLRLPGTPMLRQWNIVVMRARALSPAAETFRYYTLENSTTFLENCFPAVAHALKNQPIAAPTARRRGRAKG